MASDSLTLKVVVGDGAVDVLLDVGKPVGLGQLRKLDAEDGSRVGLWVTSRVWGRPEHVAAFHRPQGKEKGALSQPSANKKNMRLFHNLLVTRSKVQALFVNTFSEDFCSTIRQCHK